MIVKNERENLPRCLSSVQPYVDEIVIVDTGSQNGTPELALEYGAKVFYFEWCDNLALTAFNLTLAFNKNHVKAQNKIDKINPNLKG